MFLHSVEPTKFNAFLSQIADPTIQKHLSEKPVLYSSGNAFYDVIRASGSVAYENIIGSSARYYTTAAQNYMLCSQIREEARLALIKNPEDLRQKEIIELADLQQSVEAEKLNLVMAKLLGIILITATPFIFAHGLVGFVGLPLRASQEVLRKAILTYIGCTITSCITGFSGTLLLCTQVNTLSQQRKAQKLAKELLGLNSFSYQVKNALNETLASFRDTFLPAYA